MAEIVIEDLPKVLAAALMDNPVTGIDADMIERLAAAHIERDPSTWLQCKSVLKQYHLLREVVPRIKIRMREIEGIRSIGGPPEAERSVSEIWEGSPVNKHVYVPPDYTIMDGTPAISRLEKRMVGDSPYEKRIPVCLDPLLVTRRIGHVQSKAVLLEIQFRTSSGWRKIIDDRDVWFSSRKIVDTARMGVPVASDNALELVSWIRHYENANRDQIPIGYASSSMGWQGDEANPTQHGYLCGVRQIGGNGRAIELEGSDGDMAEAREIKPRGSFEVWRDTVARLIRFPAVQLGIFASLAAPLIAIVDGPNAVIEWAGRTTTGKSTLLKIAQSCWRSAGTHMATWNTTIIGIEASAQFMCDMPLVIDDTSAAVEGGRSQNIGKVIYQLVSGRARGRAMPGGGSKIRSRWRTVVLATGETPLGELAKAEGASARVLTFWSAPLGDPSPETGELIAECIHTLSENYGHAGPRVVQWLCDNRERWDDLRTLFAETARKVREEIRSPAAARLAEVIALLQCAAFVAKESGCTPWMTRPLMWDPDLVAALRSAMMMATENSDRAYGAWEYAIGEASSKPNSWVPWGSNPDSERDPPGGWLGFKTVDDYAWFPQQLRKALLQGSFVPESAFRAWKDLDVLVHPERSRFTSQCRPSLDRATKLRLIRVKNSYPGYEIDDADDD